MAGRTGNWCNRRSHRVVVHVSGKAVLSNDYSNGRSYYARGIKRDTKRRTVTSVAKGLDSVMADYRKLHEEDGALETEIKTLETAIDSHSVDNRNKRKALQERRNTLAKTMEALGQKVQQGQKALDGLYQSVEASLQLAEHAETWEWREAGLEPLT